MIWNKSLSVLLAGCILTTGLVSAASAQPWMDRDWDRGRDWRERDWDRGDRWRGRGRDRDCYYERRRERNRFGDVVIRRYRICEE